MILVKLDQIRVLSHRGTTKEFVSMSRGSFRCLGPIRPRVSALAAHRGESPAVAIGQGNVTQPVRPGSDPPGHP